MLATLHPTEECMWVTVRWQHNKVIQPGGEVIAAEGDSVTLNCTFEIRSDYFFWYRQFPGKAPEFLISHFGTGKLMSNPVPGFSIKVSKGQEQMNLEISSPTVTDSAVYYCAVKPTVTGNNKTLYKNLHGKQYFTTSTRGHHTL
uniref:Ig-like domain-containing protein n=1 Tax=Oryzias melastigma TaxID=30732 RepID=A0A3B3DEZ7_ORYME